MAAPPELLRTHSGGTRALPAFLLAAAVLAAGLSLAAGLRSAEARADTEYLTILTTVVLAALAPGLAGRVGSPAGTAAPGPTLFGLGTGLAVLALWALPVGPTRYAALFLVLVTLLCLATRRVVAHLRARPGFAAPPPAIHLFAAVYPLLIAAQVLLRPERWLAPWSDARTLVSLLGLPALAALALTLLARREGVRPVVVAAALALLPAPGITVVVTGALLTLAALREGLERATTSWRWLPAVTIPAALLAWQPGAWSTLGLVAGLGGVAVFLGRRQELLPILEAAAGLLFFGSALLAAPPWLRPQPLVALAELLGTGGLAWLLALLLVLLFASVGRRMAPAALRRLDDVIGVAAQPMGVLLGGVVLILAAGAAAPAAVIGAPGDLPTARPVREHLLAGELVSAVVIESRLSHAAHLPVGSPALTLRAWDRAGRQYVHRLRAGVETGEWAARRGDVAPHYPLPSKALWRGQLVSPDRFFGQTYRARWRLPRPVRLVRLQLERSSSLPREVGVWVERLEVKR